MQTNLEQFKSIKRIESLQIIGTCDSKGYTSVFFVERNAQHVNLLRMFIMSSFIEGN